MSQGEGGQRPDANGPFGDRERRDRERRDRGDCPWPGGTLRDRPSPFGRGPLRDGPLRRWWSGADGGSAPRLPWRAALVVAFVQVVGSTEAQGHQTERVHLNAPGYVLLLLGPALLPFRLRRPTAVVYATAAVTLGYLAAGYPYGPFFLSFAVAFGSAVYAGRRRHAWAAAVGLYGCHLLLSHWLYRWLPPSGDAGAGWVSESAFAAWLLAFGAAVELGRVRREQFARNRRERAEAERRRADEERLRIARELHDVVAHSLSVISVQAGVGLALIDEHPEQARTALTTIRATSKEALGEVRQVLDSLRSPGSAPKAPAPGLDRVPELARQAAAAGLDVRVTTEGGPRRLAPGADLAAFRIVQEALTNIVRHSGARSARVHVDYRAGALRLSVDDDGPATGDGDSGGGNGLIGMRERAAALGGTVEAGPRGDGGFRVVATLPLPDADAPTAETSAPETSAPETPAPETPAAETSSGEGER
ncbi:sensor histidine kinase [Streptantibioticus parmotrematis]|uniref:sensor histidine kinase n=1 Tax=Streptantibioticus parmotrematis TaxID=2873249 RepID=UPI0033DC6A5F